MGLRVKLHGRFRMAAGTDEIEVPNTVGNIAELLEQLTNKLGLDVRNYMFEAGTGELSPRLIILVNGHSVKMLDGLRTHLAERDSITIDSVDIMEVVGGG
jgi:molybdopterin converting factor small subunit